MSRSGGLSKARLARMSGVLRGYVERGAVPGFVALVARGAQVHVEAFGVQDLAAGTPMRRDTIFRIASMTKPIAAAAAMILVEETKLKLDAPVDKFLPELANRKVLRSMDGALDDTAPANRSITLRDLLTFRAGLGAVMAPPGRYPIQAALTEAEVAPGPKPSPLDPDTYMRRIASLPLMHQPGEKWMYHTGSDILGVLVARASGMAFEDFLAERIFAPLGMKDTGFFAPAVKLDRLATSYRTDPETGKFAVYDAAQGGAWSRKPAFASGGGGLVSTVDDYLAFARMMVATGSGGADRILARPTVELMITDHITDAQKAASPFVPGFWDNGGWGFGLFVVTRRADVFVSPGAYGWNGGLGTTWTSDPREDLTAILLTQRMMGGADDTILNENFLTLAYQALDD